MSHEVAVKGSSGAVVICKLGCGWRVFLQDGPLACKGKRPAEQGENHSPFYDLFLDFIYRCFCQVLLVTHINSGGVGELTQGQKYQLAEIFGGSLGGRLPPVTTARGPVSGSLLPVRTLEQTCLTLFYILHCLGKPIFENVLPATTIKMQPSHFKDGEAKA